MTATEPRVYFHGSRVDLKPQDLVEPVQPAGAGGDDALTAYVYLTTRLDAAIWSAELATGDGPGRVFRVEPTGELEDASPAGQPAPPHVAMSLRSRRPLRVISEVTDWLYYHGTRATLAPGDLIVPGQRPNYGDRTRTTSFVYLARTLDAATWGAELAAGDGPGHIYVVEPTGPIEDDPNVTDQKFRGNPTKSYRTRDPLRVIRELASWTPHAPDVVKAMKDGLARLEQLGVEPIDD